MKTKSKAKKVRSKKAPAAKKSAPARKSAARKAPAPVAARRADFGAPIEGFFTKQPPHLRPILDELRTLIEENAPDATASIKWGMPFFAIRAGHGVRSQEFNPRRNLIVAGPPEIFDDPDGHLEGDAKDGRHMKLRTLDGVPRHAVRGWVRAAAKNAHPPSGSARRAGASDSARGAARDGTSCTCR